MKTGFVAACFAAAIAVSPGTASAALLTYTETADVSGSLDGVPFTDNELTLKASGDTSGVSGGPSFFFLYVPLTFTLSGGGSGTFTDNETAVIDNQSITLAGFTDFTTGEFALGTLSAVFATYDLRTIIGPVSGGAIFNPGSSFATSAGTFSHRVRERRRNLHGDHPRAIDLGNDAPGLRGTWLCGLSRVAKNGHCSRLGAQMPRQSVRPRMLASPDRG